GISIRSPFQTSQSSPPAATTSALSRDSGRPPTRWPPTRVVTVWLARVAWLYSVWTQTDQGWPTSIAGAGSGGRPWIPISGPRAYRASDAWLTDRWFGVVVFSASLAEA